MRDIVELLEGFLHTIPLPVLINCSADSVEGGAHAASHFSLDAIPVALELVDHDLRDEQLESPLTEELPACGDERARR